MPGDEQSAVRYLVPDESGYGRQGYFKPNEACFNRADNSVCGRQNIPLRGHRDSATDLERGAPENQGNFRAFEIPSGVR